MLCKLHSLSSGKLLSSNLITTGIPAFGSAQAVLSCACNVREHRERQSAESAYFPQIHIGENITTGILRHQCHFSEENHDKKTSGDRWHKNNAIGSASHQNLLSALAAMQLRMLSRMSSGAAKHDRTCRCGHANPSRSRKAGCACR